MTEWTEQSVSSTSWTEAETNVPKPGMQAGVVGDEWDELWSVGHDFTPWAQGETKETEWTESS